MIKRTNEIKVGVTILLATALLYSGFRFMKDLPLLHPDGTFYAQFPQVTGLATGRSVFMNGVDVGKVQRINLLPNDSVSVQITISASLKIPDNSVAVLRSIDVLGTKAVEILKGTSETPFPNHSKIPGQVEADMMGKMMESGVDLTGELGTTIYKLNNILGEMDNVVTTSGSKDLKKVLDNASKTTEILYQSLNKKKGDIEKTIAHLESITANTSAITKDNKAKVDKIIANLEKASDEMDDMSKNIASLSSELNILLKKINKGEGTLGKLANDPSLYNHMDSTMVSLNKLLKDVQRDPKRYTKDLKLMKVF